MQAGVECNAQVATMSEMTREGVFLGGTHVAGSRSLKIMDFDGERRRVCCDRTSSGMFADWS
jgi:hypothetical protein